jgi:hypothetical protein
MEKGRYMDAVKLILGAVLVILGIVRILIKVAIALGWITPPPDARLRQAEENGGANAWDLLLALLDKAGWLVVVGLLLIGAGVLLLDEDLSFLFS